MRTRKCVVFRLVTLGVMTWTGCSPTCRDTLTCDTGTGGGEPGSGKSAVGVVGGGGVIKSSTFEMVIYVGQSTQNQGTMTSPGFSMQGGLAASNGSSP